VKGCTRRFGGRSRLIARALATAGLGLVLGVGCGGGPHEVSVDLTEGQMLTAWRATHPPDLTEDGLHTHYRLDVGDRIEVEFFYYPERTRELFVRPDGCITVPGLGDLAAAGREPAAVAAEIEDHFADILLDPTVTVTVKEIASPMVYVVGLVKQPGAVPYEPGISAATAISAAGGPADGAKLGSVVIVRRVSTYRVVATRLDLDGVFSGTDPSGDLYLESYDIVFVPKRFISKLRDATMDIVRISQPIINKGWYFW